MSRRAWLCVPTDNVNSVLPLVFYINTSFFYQLANSQLLFFFFKFMTKEWQKANLLYDLHYETVSEVSVKVRE